MNTPERFSLIIVSVIISVTVLLVYGGVARAGEPAHALPPVVQEAEIGPAGGRIALTDNAGNVIELLIPTGALDDTISVTLTAPGEMIRNPVGKNVLHGFRIEPENLLLNQPAVIRITFPASVTGIDKICAFSIIRDDFVLPLADMKAGSQTVEGRIYFFGKYAAGIPAYREILAQISKAKEGNLSAVGRTRSVVPGSSGAGSCPPLGFGWEGTESSLHGLLEWAGMLSALGHDDEAAQAIHATEKLAENAIKDFLSMDIPYHPCGKYTRAAWEYFEMSKLFEISPEVRDAIEKHAMAIADRCAIQFTIEIDREIVNTSNEKEHIKSYGVVTGSIKWSDFSDGEAPATGHGALSYSYDYSWVYNNALKYKSTAKANGTIGVTADGRTVVKSASTGEVTIRLNVSLHFKDDIKGTACDTKDKEKPCQDTESHKEWNETADFLFVDGAKFGYEQKTKYGFVRNMMTLHIIRMDQQDDPDICY